MQKTVLFLFGIIFFVSCGNKNSQQSTNQSISQSAVEYAQGFAIHDFEKYKEVSVFNPWKKGEIYAKYFLVNDENTEVPVDGVKIKIPLQTIAVASVTHLEFLSLLGEIESITGICTPKLVYNKAVQRNFSEGKITDLGDPFSINVEKTMVLRPNALLMSGFNQSDANAQRVQQAGIPVIYNNEWMETSLLGRAEWIKFVSAFYEKEEIGDSIFKEIVARYNEMKIKASNADNRPRIMAGSNFRGTWYMPAGRSFMNELFQDAGGQYFYQNDTTSGSLPLNVETVLKNFSNTDVWLNCNFSTIEDLVKSDSKHALFRPVKENRVYNFNKRFLPTTANDYWESAVARPDLLLGDVIAILHPEILPEWEFVYAAPLK
ncbi:MAG: ABC transporter substrate-binding protein [Porphyromonadaceae bacterium]|nr:ABC transporter substrate-binding protein [Porphyromonadaceae bacterium]